MRYSRSLIVASHDLQSQFRFRQTHHMSRDISRMYVIHKRSFVLPRQLGIIQKLIHLMQHVCPFDSGNDLVGLIIPKLKGELASTCGIVVYVADSTGMNCLVSSSCVLGSNETRFIMQKWFYSFTLGQSMCNSWSS